MAIEIKELIIKTVIEEKNTSTAKDVADLQEMKELILLECKEMLKEWMERSKNR